MKWTTEQNNAIHLSGSNLLVAAGAGSGKTAVLVERIVEMISGEDAIDVDNLLVVTFTKAAATEMRERIGRRIADKLNENPSDENLLKQMALMNRSNIMTLHSFCNKVVKENFQTIDLDPDSSLMDDHEAILVKSEALSKVLEDSYKNEDPDFLRLSDTLGGIRDDKKLEEYILKLYEFSMSGPSPIDWIKMATSSFDHNVKSIDDLEWIKILRQETFESLEEVVRSAQRALALVNDSPAAISVKYHTFFDKEASDLLKLARMINGGKSYEENQRILQNFKFEKLPVIRNLEPAEKEYQEKIKRQRDEYKKILDELKYEWFFDEGDYSLTLMKEMAPVLKALGTLVERFMEEYKILKADRKRMDYSDLEHNALKILCHVSLNNEGDIIVNPKEAAEKYRLKFNEILVDEYQDSNDVQETIIKAVSRDNTNVFMVGDVKQSIYRFRRAKPELFLQKYKSYSLPNEDLTNGRKIMLFRNFRSRSEILNVVNFIFKRIMSERAGELNYTEDEALIAGAEYDYEEAIPVEFDLIDTRVEEGAQMYSDDDEVSDEGQDDDLSAVEVEAKHVASRIRELVEFGDLKVEIKGIKRPLMYKDIVILLRSTKNRAEVFEKALNDLSVPVYSEASTGYFESIEIRTMLSLLKVIDNPRQDIPLLSVLRSPLFSFREDELIDIRYSNKKLLIIDCLKEMAEFETPLGIKANVFLNTLDKWRYEAIHMELDEFIWKLYSDTAYYEYVGAMPNGAQRQANLRILFQRAGSYEKTAFKGLFNFMRYIDTIMKKDADFGEAKIFGENEDVVRIMSIHKSKGLEFPVVFLSNSSKKFNTMDMRSEVIIHEKLGIATKNINIESGTSEDTIQRKLLKRTLQRESYSEEMRILYVAMTRARERLIVTGTVKDLTKKIETWIETGDTENGEIKPYRILKSDNYLDWVMPVILNDVEIDENINSLETQGTLKSNNGYILNLYPRQDILKKDAILEEEKASEFWGGEKITDQELMKILTFEYPDKKSSELPGKISVSVVKKKTIEENTESSDSVEILDEEHEMDEKILPRPEFLMEIRELSGAERGTAFHTVMFHINPGVSTIGEVEEEIKRLVREEIILSREAETVNRYKVLNFFKSDLGLRYRDADLNNLLYREEVFYRAVDPNIYDKDANTHDRMTMIGIIDAFFIEDGEIVLLDYKTDSIPQDSLDYLKTRYESQIDLYRESLESITGLRVKEAYLYSVSKEEVIKMI